MKRFIIFFHLITKKQRDFKIWVVYLYVRMFFFVLSTPQKIHMEPNVGGLVQMNFPLQMG